MALKIRRAYDQPTARDGTRILVDGLWPRGVSKADLKIAKWEKDIAPSRCLRTWYGHDADKWPEFRTRYREELEESPRKEALDYLVGLAEKGNLTLVFSARDAEHSNAAVIAEVIEARLNRGRRMSARAGGKPRKTPADRNQQTS